MQEHNAGETVSTKSGRPWKLIYYEAFVCKEDALEREKFLKSGWGRKHLQKILKTYFEE